jgi:CheY-like chemotaxis protein
LAGQKCALIVDDSRTARQVLRQLLTAHQLRVETAESAEDALEYLSTARPDVIFMDHMMPGMDGFQAVRAIKDNPATATIPIMMYTSQEGELYVGQARALGAIGVLPKQIKPVEVTEILQSLHLIPDDAAAGTDAQAAGSQHQAGERTLADVSAKMDIADWSELHHWLTEMLNQHSQSLKEDLETSMRRVLDERRQNVPDRRLNTTDRRQGPRDRRQESTASNGISTDAGATPTTDTPLPPASPEPRANPLVTTVMIGLGLLSAVLLAMQLSTQRQLDDVTARNDELTAALKWQRNDRSQSDSAPEGYWDTGPAARNSYLDFLSAIEWSVNQAGGFEPGETPLGDSRVDWLDGLVARLRNIGFAGVIQIDTHVGEFCQVEDKNGTFSLAPEELPLLDCDRLGLDAEEALRLSSRQSVRFANYVAALQKGSSNVISIEINPLGIAAPAAAYPPGLAGVTAGDWNRVARQNNRVQVALLPD